MVGGAILATACGARADDPAPSAGGGAGGAGVAGQAGGSGSGSGTGGVAGSSGAAGAAALCPAQKSWTCDPTASGACAGSGSACDIATKGGNFQCYPGPANDIPVGGTGCAVGSHHCVPGATCDPMGDTCLKMCCSNADCGAGTCTEIHSVCVNCGPWPVVGVCK